MRVSLIALALALLACVAGCPESPPDADAGADSGQDLTRDAGIDAPLAPTDGGPPEIDAATDAPSDVGPAPCTLTPSGALVIDTDDAVIERLDITSTEETAILVRADRVTLRDLRIRHNGGIGIYLDGAQDVIIEHVDIDNVGAPERGAAANPNQSNIVVYDSPRVTVRHARLARGSTGIYVQASVGSRLSDIEGHDFRGPFPRGQLVQWNGSDDGSLEGFSVLSDDRSWPEDNVNAYRSHGIVIRDGLVEGNNSRTGVAVLFDEDSTGIVEDVEALRMGNGCFSNYTGGNGNVFRRTHCRDNICTDQGRGPPASNALMYGGNPEGPLARIEESHYWNSCNGNVWWPTESFEVLDLTEAEFTPRAPREVSFCFGR